MVLAGLIAGVLLARSVTESLRRMALLIKDIEANSHATAIDVQGEGEFAALTRDIISMRGAVESRANAASARQAELEAERVRLAQERQQHEADVERQQQITRRAQREQLAAEFELQVSGIISNRGVRPRRNSPTTASKDMAESAATSAQRSRDASSVAEHTSGAAAEVATGTGDLSARAQSVRENAEQSKSRATSAVKEAALANEQLGHLLTAVRQISTITDLIAGVARQTNLLAINARIEAARAGEAGRGFSIVADEVKALARKTGEATDGIEKNILQINAAAARSSESLHLLLEVIAGVDHAATEIFAVTDAQVESTRELTQRISEISTSTRSVTTDIRAAQETAHATEQMSSDMVRAAAVIEEQTEHLRDQVGRFVIGLRAAGTGTGQAAATTPRAYGERLQTEEMREWRAVAS